MLSGRHDVYISCLSRELGKDSSIVCYTIGYLIVGYTKGTLDDFIL